MKDDHRRIATSALPSVSRSNHMPPMRHHRATASRCKSHPLPRLPVNSALLITCDEAQTLFSSSEKSASS
ncbi:hypothetical protein BGW80DRAFT_1369545 [Lactifluus volemus]|nr:hypothetical protein BGW80DRAFT_1369545 [Lactifluus volemus]